MTQPYSEDLRERAALRLEAGETTRSIGHALNISPSCVAKWYRLKRKAGSLSPGEDQWSQAARVVWGIGRLAAKALSVMSIYDTVGGLRPRVASKPIAARVGVPPHRGSQLQKGVLPARHDRPDIARRRQRWKAHQHRIEPNGSSSSIRPGSRPTWPHYAAADRGDSACSRKFLMAIGRH